MKNVLNSVELYEHLGKSVDLCENPGNAMSLYEYVKYITFSSVYDTSYRHQAHRALKGDLHEDQFAYHNMYLQGQRKEGERGREKTESEIRRRTLNILHTYI